MKVYYGDSPYITKEEREKQCVELLNIPSSANVHSIPDNWIIVEFDKADGFNKDNASDAIFEFTCVLSDKGIPYEQRSHNGFCDWIIIKCEGLENLSPEERTYYINNFYNKYIPEKYLNYVDDGFAKTKIKWCTIVGKLHWKKATKYEGKSWDEYTEEKIIDVKFPKGKYKIEKELIKKIEKENKKETKGFVKGNRNNALFEKTIELVKDYNKQHKEPLPIKEVENVVRSVTSYPTLNLTNYMDNAATFYETNSYFYDDEVGVFWLWSDEISKYEMISEPKMMEMFDRLLGFQGQTVTSGVKNNHLEAFRRHGIRNRPKDAPLKWVQFKDKAFSLTSKKIHQINSKFFFTNPIPWSIGNTSETPTMDKLFTEWVGEKYLPDLYEIIAYCCYRDYPIQSLICLYGAGRNGKSSFLKIIDKFIGQDNITSTELDLLVGHNFSRFESAKMYKKLICIMGETNFGVLDKSSFLKKLVGGDKIGFEMKGKKPFSDYNYAKMIIASNSLPSSEDTSEGFYRRWHIIDFPNQFPEGKDITLTIPDSEYEALAKKCCEILPKLLDKGEFTNQGTIVERRDKYIMASNPFPKFIEKFCRKDRTEVILYSELYIHYVSFLRTLKRRKVKMKEFKSALEDEGYWVERTSKKVDGEWRNDRWISGLCMNPDIDFNDFCDNLHTNLKWKIFVYGELEKPALKSQTSQSKPQHIVEETIQPQDVVSYQKNPYKTHQKCHKCGLSATDGWEYQDKDGNIICDVCAGVL